MSRFAPPVVVQRLHQTRTLAHVLLEIADAEKRLSNHWGDADLESELLDKLGALQTEARTMVSEATGVSWDALQRGLS